MAAAKMKSALGEKLVPLLLDANDMVHSDARELLMEKEKTVGGSMELASYCVMLLLGVDSANELQQAVVNVVVLLSTSLISII